MIEDVHLTTLIDVDILQKIQDSFSAMTGIAALTTDVNGVPVTKGSLFSDFCMKYTRQSPIGCLRCEQCDKHGAELALKNGSYVIYPCHAGLYDFAAPIMANGTIVGCFVGGQVLTQPPETTKVLEVAKEIDVNPIDYLQAAMKLKVIPKKELDKAAEFLYNISTVLSNITSHKYMVLQANKEIEKAARMKSDFLANMSHEIRTPMNAVIGMAEMALREDLPPAARDYITQIKASGRTLLTIINDILDFSKIESGKMDIISEEYTPMSVINDVVNMITTRLGEKNVELILDIDPTIPYELFGDSVRLKQIITNLSNNAVKFTNNGQVILKMGYTRVSKDEILLRTSVEDTGIGIKKENLDQLFQSFQQLDSKRNRNIEGTGLGLAICKQLLTLMNGDIKVESIYGKGSIFTFTLPQKISIDKPSLPIKRTAPISAAILCSNPYVAKQVKTDILRFKINYIPISSEDDLPFLTNQQEVFLFVDDLLFSENVEKFILDHPKITAVLMTDFHTQAKYRLPNLRIQKKPLYALNMATIFNREELHMNFSENMNDDFDFIAPTAEILIVDDNAINLTVAEGLLEPLKMKIETALSGKEAIDKISCHHYDLIFMDHMMPEVDGVETTHIIRRFHPEYNDVPIIALTANAVSGTRKMFLEEGMNDFVAKPIEVRVMISKLKSWLPLDKIQKLSNNLQHTASPAAPSNISIEGLDTEAALKLVGSEKLFWAVLKDYYRVIEKKANLIKELEEKEAIPEYTIEVHALKSASKQVGAMKLSELAAQMEKAGNEKNTALIHQCTDDMLEQYRQYIPILKPHFPEEKDFNTNKPEITPKLLSSFFADMRLAFEDLDMDQMEEVVKEMKQYHYPEEQQKLFSQLQELVEDIDIDGCENIMKQWETIK